MRSSFEKQSALVMGLLLLLTLMLGVLCDPISANEYCPVLTDQKVDSTIFVDYQGSRVYFCCTKCRRQFLADPGAYLANLPEFKASTPNPNSLPGRADTVRPDMSGMAMTASPNRPASGGGEPYLIRLAGKLHPLVIHFPIALIISAAFFSLLAISRKKPVYDTISIRLIYLALASAVVAVLFGQSAEATSSFPAILADYVEWHGSFALWTGACTLLSAALGYLSERPGREGLKRWYHLALLVNAILVGITGHFGATLVYGPSYFKM